MVDCGLAAALLREVEIPNTVPNPAALRGAGTKALGLPSATLLPLPIGEVTSGGASSMEAIPCGLVGIQRVQLLSKVASISSQGKTRR